MTSLAVIPFRVEHWHLVETAPLLIPFAPSAEQLQRLETDPLSRTIVSRATGRPVFVGGALHMWTGRAELWARVDRGCRRDMVAITREVAKFIAVDCSKIRRLEAVVECDFEPGHRWVRMLGFRLDAARMPAFYPDGRDCSLYSRILVQGPSTDCNGARGNRGANLDLKEPAAA